MKLANLILATWLVSFTSLFGQVHGVTVDVNLEQEQFLPDEDLKVSVKITNRSGQTLQLGKDDTWLTFSIESRDNLNIENKGLVPVTGAFSLDSSLSGTKHVNLTPYFDFTRPGGYHVVATVKIPQWNEQIVARSKSFEVVAGRRLSDLEFGVPLEGKQTGSPEIRHYILQQAVYLKQMRLYVRLTDASTTKTLKLISLAPMTSFSHPEAQIDKFSNLHLLSQMGARAFVYAVFNPDGQMLVREMYDYSDSRPVLKFNDEGRVRVFGGMRHYTPNDLPAPLEIPTPAAAPAPQEALTQNNVTPAK